MNKKKFTVALFSLVLALTAAGQTLAEESTEGVFQIDTNAPAVVEEDASNPASEDLIVAEIPDIEMQDPGMLPDHPLYFLKKWKEGIGSFLTFRNEKKAERMAKLSEKRLEEVQKMLKKGKTQIIQKAVDRYQKTLGKAEARAKIAEERGKDVSKLRSILETNYQRHMQVLEKVKSQVPAEAQDKIERVMENSKERYERKSERLDQGKNNLEKKQQRIEKRAGRIEEKTQERKAEIEQKEEEINNETIEKNQEIKNE